MTDRQIDKQIDREIDRHMKKKEQEAGQQKDRQKEGEDEKRRTKILFRLIQRQREGAGDILFTETKCSKFIKIGSLQIARTF